jgi:transcriptional regulator with XRE-family HTH domain
VRYNIIGGGQVRTKTYITTYESARLRSGYDRETASMLLGISESYLEKIEFQIKKPGRETLKKMSKLYKTTMDELFV